ncbi:hypothetical protein GFS31_18450 [Leptolyngbya sp. BL0902]|uniref:hypothetical protein n=1 Tax=Leptolyngbya sp. BL0902 TaxID=1115757 RepID=UPI0018E777A2|nr:hypothetical protein [Leptolyngbya sp. BL0902]QQE65160.1 hypothetical protein GFS31_18450 [Leptolyngbya sp. BL0902]
MSLADPCPGPALSTLPLTDLVPLMLEEWPDLSQEALENVADDPEATVIYIATHTDHTRALVRRHLAELASLLPTEPPPDPVAEPAPENTRPAEPAPATVPEASKATFNATDPATVPETSNDLPSTIDQLLGELEQRTDQLMQDFKADLLPELEQKARRNLGTSLLMALGLGIIVGLLLGGKRG